MIPWPFAIFYALAGLVLLWLSPADDVLWLVCRVFGALLVLVALLPVVELIERAVYAARWR